MDNESLASMVEIVLTDKPRIQIEATYLRTCSKYFAASLDKLWMERRGLNAEQQIQPVFKLVLEKDALGDFLILQQPLSDPAQVPQCDFTESYSRDDAYYRAFQNLFGVFKHQTPQLTSLSDVKALVDLADKYDSLPVVSRAVRLHLMESDGDPAELYRQIPKNPVTFLFIGEKIRSSIIVKEAAIHAIGTWSVSKTACQKLVSNRLFIVLFKAAEVLRQKQESANIKLLALNYDTPVCFDYQMQTPDSKALATARDKIGQAFNRCSQQPQPTLCRGMLYREIASIGDPEKSPKGPRPTAGTRPIEEGASFSWLKPKIQLALGDLAECYARATPADTDIKYLLCGKLGDADLDWDGEGY